MTKSHYYYCTMYSRASEQIASLPVGGAVLIYMYVFACYCSQYWAAAPWSAATYFNIGSTDSEQVTCTCAPKLSASLVQNFDYQNYSSVPYCRECGGDGDVVVVVWW